MLLRRYCLILFASFSLLLSSVAIALDTNRIWLPKKYQAAKPKLIAAAKDAEQTERCVSVLGGEMITRKNTPENYYFVITCRDSNLKSYTLSYLYPVKGEMPEMVAEQRSKAEQKKQDAVAVEDTGVDADKALQLCRSQIPLLTDELDAVTLLEQGNLTARPWQDGFFYRLPLTAHSDLGNEVRYRVECKVTKSGETSAELVLESEGAEVICRDEVRAETVLYGRIRFDEEAIEAIPDLTGFHYVLPFEVKNRIGSVIRYQADCKLNAEDEISIALKLLPSGALAICKASLLTETLLMKSVEVAEQASAESIIDTDSGQRFKIQIPFTANDPDGNQRNFKASCLVDEEGGAEVVTAIDPDAIVDVCINELHRETKNMKQVQVLTEEIPPLQAGGESGYTALIPFDAKNPSGRTLHYQATCTVGGNGSSVISVGARR